MENISSRFFSTLRVASASLWVEPLITRKIAFKVYFSHPAYSPMAAGRRQARFLGKSSIKGLKIKRSPKLFFLPINNSLMYIFVALYQTHSDFGLRNK